MADETTKLLMLEASTGSQGAAAKIVADTWLALDEARAALRAEMPSVWLDHSGRAFGTVSDEQIEVVLLGALADVRQRSGLPRDDSPVPDTRALMKATPISGWGVQSIGLGTGGSGS